ncbi:hypothetical protein FS837_000420 [Tulasnella sp. UAMH 9824]|nr:hypothetical protein FS837_000420 [Tulasnella sp. UAMH 9824]
MTDSQYVVTRLTKTTPTWEDRGWMDIINANIWRNAWHLVRSRTGNTLIDKVEAHTGIRSNEEADRLAKEGVDGQVEITPSLEVPAGWQLEGVRLSETTYTSTYEWIRKREAKAKATCSPENVERVLEELLKTHNIWTTEAKLWLSLRKPYMRREVSDFLWLMIHGRSQCGTMFIKWGLEWEDLQFCDCGAVESMEHILTH